MCMLQTLTHSKVEANLSGKWDFSLQEQRQAAKAAKAAEAQQAAAPQQSGEVEEEQVSNTRTFKLLWGGKVDARYYCVPLTKPPGKHSFGP